MDNEKVYAMSFAKIYPLLVAKAEKKGRTLEEVNEVICWMTGYSTKEIKDAADHSVTYGDFFRNAPALNPNRKLINWWMNWLKENPWIKFYEINEKKHRSNPVQRN